MTSEILVLESPRNYRARKSTGNACLQAQFVLLKNSLLDKQNRCWPFKTLLTVCVSFTASERWTSILQDSTRGQNRGFSRDRRLLSGFQNFSFSAFQFGLMGEFSRHTSRLLMWLKVSQVTCNARVVRSTRSVTDVNLWGIRCQLTVLLCVSVLLQLQRSIAGRAIRVRDLSYTRAFILSLPQGDTLYRLTKGSDDSPVCVV